MYCYNQMLANLLKVLLFVQIFHFAISTHLEMQINFRGHPH